MESVLTQKQQLRSLFRKQRFAMTSDEVNTKSKIINENFINHLLPKIYSKSSDSFSLYLPSYNEVNTSIIAEHFKNKLINFSYPKIISPNHPLSFILYHDKQFFEKNKIFSKISEPKIDNNSEHITPKFIIMPLLAFDHLGNRLGMGGGYFDRTINYLKIQNLEIITIGLAYDFQRLESTLPIENNDQKLDFIVTETNIFSAS